MAVTVTTVLRKDHYYIATVIATADSDTTATLTHTLGAAPDEVTITPLIAAGHTSLWTLTTLGATTVTLTKGTAVGSGNASAQIRVVCRRLYGMPQQVNA